MPAVQAASASTIMCRVICIFALFCVGATVYAQNLAGEIRPPSEVFRDLKDKPEALVPSQRPTIEVAPVKRVIKPVSGLRIDVTSFRFTGLTTFDPKRLEAVVQKFTGPGKMFEDLQSAADAASEYMQQHGYFVAQVYLPEQVLADGVVELAVLEGRLDKVTIDMAEDVPVFRSMIEGLLGRLTPGTVMHRDTIERALFLVSDLRAVKVRSIVEPGSAPGTSNLIVRITASHRRDGLIEFDNYGSRFIGENRMGATININSPFGRGDLLSFRGLKAYPGGGQDLVFGRVSYLTPFWNYGTKVGVAFSHLEYHLGTQAFEPLRQSGEADIWSVFALHPVVRSRNFNLFAQASYDVRDFIDDRAAVNLKSNRRTTVGSVGIVGDSRDSFLRGGINNFSLSFVPGNVELQSPIDFAADQSVTGHHVAGNYWRVNGSVSRLSGVTQNTVLYISYAFQKAGKNLDASEKLGLGGPNAVRAFPVGEATSDEWQLLTVEYRVNIPQKFVPGEITIAPFYDYGRGRANRLPLPTEIQTNTRVMQGFGLGFSWSRTDDFLVRLSMAWRLTGVPIADTVDRKPRVYFQLQKNLAF